MKKYISVIILLIVGITMISQIVYAQDEYSTIKAKVIKNDVIEKVKQDEGTEKQIQKVTIRVLEGEYKNEEYEMNYIISEDTNSIASNTELKENSNILVEIEEKDGEIVNINYKETTNQNYTLYIIGAILILLLLILSRKRAIIVYLVIILSVSYIFVFGMQQGWNLILIASVLSLVITIALFISTNGIKIKAIVMILKAILGTAISGILMYLLFDFMGLNDMNVKITESLVNIKDLICSATMLFACGIYNVIAISEQYIFNANKKPYKIKSDNIIEGQRSLKL